MHRQNLADLLLNSNAETILVVDRAFTIYKSNLNVDRNNATVDPELSFVDLLQKDSNFMDILAKVIDEQTEILNWRRADASSVERQVSVQPVKIENAIYAMVKISSVSDEATTFLNHHDLRLQIVNELSTSFANDRCGNDLFDFILKDIAQKTNSEYGVIAELIATDNQDVLTCLSFFKDSIVEHDSKAMIESDFFKEILNHGTSIHTNLKQEYSQNPVVRELNINSLICHPLKDGNGGAIGLLCLMQQKEAENTDYMLSLLRIAGKRCEMELHRQRYEKLIDQKNFELKRQSTEMASFTYIASHDLQEPLRKIRMFSSRILDNDKDKLSEKSLLHFQNITSTADRMQKLINALLTYSSMDSDDLSMERVNLNKLLKEVIASMSDLLTDKQVVINAADLPTLQAIPLQFHQLLYNLLSNAIKYGKDDVITEINISAIKTTVKQQSFWRIDIADNGIGFDPQYKDKIFEVFQRLHGKQEYAGTGVGLAICSKVVKNHRGFITADGIPGIGATFSVFIPTK